MVKTRLTNTSPNRRHSPDNVDYNLRTWRLIKADAAEPLLNAKSLAPPRGQDRLSIGWHNYDNAKAADFPALKGQYHETNHHDLVSIVPPFKKVIFYEFSSLMLNHKTKSKKIYTNYRQVFSKIRIKKNFGVWIRKSGCLSCVWKDKITTRKRSFW
jgi:hypothetical protein